MNELEDFKDRLIKTLQETIDYSTPYANKEEFGAFVATKNIIELIKRHP